ncbi:MAG TPA: FKBP-type peptidyl-prolyl cis-trans isomerase [Lacunisphaera sp.]|nr:FKBP-type peptidyl-prolyl cis-trans isomerase [Lacunisphaera sp.]
MNFRSHGILLILGLVLVFIAWQARTGVFRRHSPTDLPANKYTRQMMENPQLSEADAAIMREQYGTAHLNPSGLRYLVHAPGQGAPPARGATVVVHYDGYFLDGTKFESSHDLGKPITFQVGIGQVIKGWDEALLAMKKGEKRTLIIPYWLAYGESSHGKIPPRATLRFEVELVDIR